MKALKIILIVLGVLVAAILVVPLFSPSTAEVSAEIDIAREAPEFYPAVASFANRDLWDPWLTQDSTAEAFIEPREGYVGSTYAWKGEKVGQGRMEVVSVRENEYIESSLWFGEAEEPALVEWSFEPVEAGTHVIWSFTQETAWPVERLGMMFGKIFLKQSFELGLANLKAYVEDMPRASSSLGSITVATRQPMLALVAAGAGTMETISEQLGELYAQIAAEAQKQGLEMVGPAFVHYLDYDETTGYSNYRAGFMVDRAGTDAGQVMAVEYPEMQVVQAVHTGPYEEFTNSYDKMDQYIKANGLEITGEGFEFYITGMMTESDNSKWETLIAFPLR